MKPIVNIEGKRVAGRVVAAGLSDDLASWLAVLCVQEGWVFEEYELGEELVAVFDGMADMMFVAERMPGLNGRDVIDLIPRGAVGQIYLVDESTRAGKAFRVEASVLTSTSPRDLAGIFEAMSAASRTALEAVS